MTDRQQPAQHHPHLAHHGQGDAPELPHTTIDVEPVPPAPQAVSWHERCAEVDDGTPVRKASVAVKSSVIARAGKLMLSAGTGAYRVRQVLRRVSAALGVECRADLTLMSIDLTVTDGPHFFTEVVALSKAGVNTERIWRLEGFVCDLEKYAAGLTVGEVHALLDDIEHCKPRYAAWQSALASACACGAFVFLLGGGAVEMGCAAAGAGAGQLVRKLMGGRHINQFATTMAAVAVACLLYLAVLFLIDLACPGAAALHEAGYIGAMLFVIPGFPLITAGLDIAKMDLASGIERLTYAMCVVGVATLAAWCVAKLVTLYPATLLSPDLAPLALVLLRLAMSFTGVFGFSIMFNSTPRMAATAGCIGAVANTLRLELVDLASMPPEAAAVLGALTAGLLASVVGPHVRLPRISLTVPSIVIMVPGLYLYEAMYYMCDFDVLNAMGWGTRAMIVIVCLPIGLALARIITDKNWRYDA